MSVPRKLTIKNQFIDNLPTVYTNRLNTVKNKQIYQIDLYKYTTASYFVNYHIEI